MIRYDNLGDQFTGAKLAIFPNPASAQISLLITPEKEGPAVYHVSFSNAIGTVVKDITLSNTTWEGSVSGLLPGTNLVRVVDNKTKSLVAEGKFVRL
jgi:hypothetical protein